MAGYSVLHSPLIGGEILICVHGGQAGIFQEYPGSDCETETYAPMTNRPCAILSSFLLYYSLISFSLAGVKYSFMNDCEVLRSEAQQSEANRNGLAYIILLLTATDQTSTIYIESI
jgi:hypothetical protein